MKKSFVLLVSWMALFAFSGEIQAQLDESREKKWEISAQVGHQSLALGVPAFSIFHPGLGLSLWRQWNQSEQHQWGQQVVLDFFVHQNLQQALRLYTEVGYRWKSKEGFQLAPLLIGGGYVMSFTDLPTYEPDANGQYQEKPLAVRNNFLISLGPEIGYQFAELIGGKDLGVWLTYRIQVQGPFGAVPVIAYSPLWLRLSLPLH